MTKKDWYFCQEPQEGEDTGNDPDEGQTKPPPKNPTRK